MIYINGHESTLQLFQRNFFFLVASRMNYLFVVLYYIWKYIAKILYKPSFIKTHHVPLQDFLGHYYQIAQTPNWFQKTGLSSAFYQQIADGRSGEPDRQIYVTNIEYKQMSGDVALSKYVRGTLLPAPDDKGTFFVNFERNNQTDYVSPIGLYRILRFEKHARLGSYLFVSSYSPKYSWLLWKPPLDKSSLQKSYEHALSLLWWFADIGADVSQLQIVKPQQLYGMLELHEFS